LPSSWSSAARTRTSSSPSARPSFRPTRTASSATRGDAPCGGRPAGARARRGPGAGWARSASPILTPMSRASSSASREHGCAPIVAFQAGIGHADRATARRDLLLAFRVSRFMNRGRLSPGRVGSVGRRSGASDLADDRRGELGEGGGAHGSRRATGPPSGSPPEPPP
jgi:hypothetical protein